MLANTEHSIFLKKNYWVGQMVIYWFHLCCVSKGGKYCNDVNPAWGYQLHSGISPVKQPEWTSTHQHTAMDGWVCGPNTLFRCVFAPQLTSIDLKRFYKCVEYRAHPTEWFHIKKKAQRLKNKLRLWCKLGRWCVLIIWNMPGQGDIASKMGWIQKVLWRLETDL
jgi:hypothetical protein